MPKDPGSSQPRDDRQAGALPEQRRPAPARASGAGEKNLSGAFERERLETAQGAGSGGTARVGGRRLSRAERARLAAAQSNVHPARSHHSQLMPLRRHKEQRSPRHRLLAVLGGIIATFAVLFLLLAIAVGIAYTQIAGRLTPRLEALHNHQSFQSSRIYDRNGTLLYEFVGQGRREVVALEAISSQLISATIAIEDATFYENSGVDYIGIIRAIYQNVTSRAEVSGASTITQQVIKNIVLTPEERTEGKRYERKIKEIVLAQELSRIYSKDEILALYLNEIPYGNMTYGIEAAAQGYFGIGAGELTLPQASLLAGLPQSPTSYNPLQYVQGDRLPGIALKQGWLDPGYSFSKSVSPPKIRQAEVLRQMVAEGYISEEQAIKAAAEDLVFVEQDVSLLAPHFVFYVKDYLEKKYGAEVVSEGGLEITTTLDMELQSMAEQEAATRIRELEAEQRNIHNAAVVVLQPNTGQVLAMVGSVSYTATLATTTEGEEGNVLDGKVNVATRQRQPGSALKPFTYLAGMEQNVRSRGEGEFPGVHPGSILLDVPTRFEDGTAEGYRPENFDRKWHGAMRPRMALANSLNMPAVKALKRTGVLNMIDLLHRAGVAPTSLSRGLDFYGLSLTLGGGEVTPLDLATANNTLASGGRYFPPTSILKIVDASGKVLEEFKPVPLPQQPSLDTSDCVPIDIEEYEQGKRLPPGTQCIDPRLVHIITNMMSDNQARTPMFGPDTIINLSQPAAVKTGTTDDFRDAWASGFTPFVTATVWTGNNNNERTAQVESTTGGGVIWARLMERIFKHSRLMQLLGQPFGGVAPVAFAEEFPGVIRKEVCNLPGGFGGPNVELFTEEMRSVPLANAGNDPLEKILSWSGGINMAQLRACDESLKGIKGPEMTETPEASPTPDQTGTALAGSPTPETSPTPEGGDLTLTPIEPTPPPIEPTLPPAEPTLPPAEPTLPPAEPTLPPAEPTLPPAEPTAPPADQPPADQEQPSTNG